ncbi:MAG: PIN domain-containing protein [Verrucomicrobiae bacterium]|nr:PIN domain-containing protein [Verrucomicrobiae bacterium]
METFLRNIHAVGPAISAVTASELLHGIKRAVDPVIKARRASKVEGVLTSVKLLPFDIAEARVHARIRAQLEKAGRLIGPHDLLIAATALTAGFDLATLNVDEFKRVPGLSVIDASAFRVEVKR